MSEEVTSRFAVEHGHLVITSTRGDRWQGRLDDCDAIKVVQRSDDDALVLLDHTCRQHRMRPFENVLLIRSDGSLRWHSEVPHPDDVFVDVRIESDRILVSSWEGWLVELDAETGRILSREWVK